MGVVSESDEFAMDLIPSVRKFTEDMLRISDCQLAEDYSKSLLELKVFNTVDNAMTVGYLCEFLLDGKPATSDNLPWVLATVLSFTSLENTPSVDFAFILFGRSDQFALTQENYFGFMELYSKLFRDGSSSGEKQAMISFVFRKTKHQRRVEEVYKKLMKAGELLGDMFAPGIETFREEIKDLYDTDDVFRKQLKCLYQPFRMLTFWIVSHVTPAVKEEKPNPLTFLKSESLTSLRM